MGFFGECQKLKSTHLGGSEHILINGAQNQLISYENVRVIHSLKNILSKNPVFEDDVQKILVLRGALSIKSEQGQKRVDANVGHKRVQVLRRYRVNEVITLYPKIVTVEVISSEFVLRVTFDNGEQVLFDVKEKFTELRYEQLKNEAFFKIAKVDPGGYGISWNDEIDFSEYEIWTTGKRVRE